MRFAGSGAFARLCRCRAILTELRLPKPSLRPCSALAPGAPSALVRGGLPRLHGLLSRRHFPGLIRCPGAPLWRVQRRGPGGHRGVPAVRPSSLASLPVPAVLFPVHVREEQYLPRGPVVSCVVVERPAFPRSSGEGLIPALIFPDRVEGEQSSLTRCRFSIC